MLVHVVLLPSLGSVVLCALVLHECDVGIFLGLICEIGVVALIVSGAFVWVSVALSAALHDRESREIFLDGEQLTLPGLIGAGTRIELRSIEKAHVRTRGLGPTSFWQLTLEWRADEVRRTVVSSQLVGPEAFDALCEDLRARGVVA